MSDVWLIPEETPQIGGKLGTELAQYSVASILHPPLPPHIAEKMPGVVVIMSLRVNMFLFLS